MNKKIDLGEYVITIYHNETTGRLDVDVFDEAGEIIESINISNDEDEDEPTDNDIGFNLN